MNSKQMTYLIETAKTLNLSRAAENLFISQPSLSYQIKIIEEEVGFAIFDRIGKSIRLTPAGQQLVTSIQRIAVELQDAIEQAQNMGDRYKNTIKIGLPSRSSLYYLPEAIRIFEAKQPFIQIVPEIQDEETLIQDFLQGQLDLLLLSKDQADKLTGISQHDLYTSQIYLLCQTSDPLAGQDLVTAQDLAGRTLLVNGGSTKTLRQVQQRVLSQVPLSHYNSPTHDFTLIQVASGKAICLSPGYLNDQTGAFAWVPFDCPEHFDFVLCHKQDNRLPQIKELIDILKDLYDDSDLDL